MAFDPNQPFTIVEEEEVGFDPTKPFSVVEPSGTSFGEEVSQLGPAFIESIGRPLENMGESFDVMGFTGVANALKDVINEPEGYVSASQRFMEPKPDEAQFLGFAWQYAPRAAVEQVGQAIGAMGTRAVGAAAGGAVAGPPGAVAGGFAGPAIFGAAQVIGPVAKERAMNNGREVPNNEDLVAATLTAIGSGSLDAIGAKYLPGGEKATGKFFKRVASSFVGEGLLTEAPQSVIEQVGATAGTEKGLNINVKQAVGEGLIGGTSAAGLSAVVYPLTKKEEPDPKKKVIRTPEQAEELDIDGKSNEEAISLMGEPADQAQNERITKLKEIEAVIANNETLMTGLEPNAPERTQLDLENKEARKEADKLKAEISKSVGLSLPITTAEQQQIELAKQIAAPIKPAPVAKSAVVPAPEVAPPAAKIESVGENKIYSPIEISEQDTGAYHFGDGGIASDTTMQKMGAGRGTGHYGTGTYFLGKKEADVQRADRPMLNINLAGLNMAKPSRSAIRFHDMLRLFNKSVLQGEEIKFDQPADNGNRIFDLLDIALIGQVSGDRKARIKDAMMKVEGIFKSGTDDKLRTPSTYLMQELGFDGIDVRGTEADNTTYGSVVFAKPILETTQTTPAPVAETPAVSPAPEVAPAPAITEEVSPIASFKNNIKNAGLKYLTYSDFRKAKKTENWENEGGVTIDESYYPTAVVGDTSIAFTTNGLSLFKNRVEVSYEPDVDVNGNNIFTIERIVTPENQRGKGSASNALSEVTKAADKAGLTLQLEPAAVSPLIKKGGKGLTNKQLVDWYKRNGFVQKFDGSDKILIRNPQPSTTPAVSETITKPKLGEAGGVLIPSREDLIQAGQNIYEAGMEFGAWAKQMIQRFGDAVRQFLADVWEAVSGFPAKLEEMAGYLPGKGERGAVTFGRGEEPPKKPAEPTPVTPAQPAPEKPAAKPTGRVEQIMSQKIGPSIKTQDGIIAKTKDKLKTLFDPEVVNEANTSTAYRAIGILSGTNRDAARQYAESINALTAEGLGEDADTANEISMGAALFVNNLFEYAVKLAAKGDRKMLGLMVSNINKLPTGQMGASDAGRTLRARVELKARFLMMAQAEQDAFTNYVAEFIYGPNPTEAQIKSIKDAYSATQKVAQPTEEELTDEIAKVGEKTYTDLVSKINDDFTKAAEKDKDARDAELKELSDEYNKIQDKAETEIEKLAEIQSDTPSFARKKVNEIRAIVSADLKQRPDMGRKAPWKSMLIAKLQNAGVNAANAETLADLVWRQHEINATSRELESINKAIEKGPISEIIKQIKDTPIEQQQDPKWRYQVMRDYLRRAGLSMAQAERIAKLMDISLQKRFTEAKEKAFTESIEKSAPWKSGDARSKRAFQQVIKAIRAGALDPSRNFLNDVAAANGWTGFTDSQYAKLIKLDSILSNPKSSDADKAEAHKAIQNIISNSKLPIRARDVIGQFYDAQALSGIPTITVNMVSPIGMAAKNALVQAASGVATFRPDQIDAAFRTLMDSIKSWANTVAYSFKNNVTVYSNVEYLVNDEGLLKLYNRGKEQFKKGKTPKDRADGVKNMMVGMWDYVRRILNALDYGAIASLQNQTVPKYALAAMQAKGMSSKDGTKMLNAMFEAKRNFYEQQIAAGVDKNKASVLADEFFVSSWRQALTDAKLPAQQVIDSAINDAMSAVGRTRASLDNFRDENTNLQDAGVTSLPALWLLQSMANAANKSDSQLIKIFARIIYGFAVVPARVFRETAWFSPYGYVRFAYDAIAKKKGLNSPYAQSLGNDLQYRQRMNEATAGTLVMLGLASALVSSIDDEDDERPFKIVVTGNGPNRADDPQFYDSWIKNNTPNSVRIQFGKTKFTINTMRGFEAFAWPAMMLGAVDDWQIRRKMNRKQNEPVAVGDAAIVAGNVFSAALKRGPYAFAAKPLFESYGDRTVESLFKSLAFPVKTLIPGVGSSLARNFSDLLNEPIDRRTLDGALWANVPFIGPAVAPKAMNAFGEPALAGEASDKLFKLGVPIVFKIGTDRDSVNIHNLVLKQGSGPSIPTRNQLAKRLDREPTNKEYELFVKEYGSFISEQMKKRYKRYDEMKPETYDKAIQKLSDVARDKAERVVRRQKKP